MDAVRYESFSDSGIESSDTRALAIVIWKQVAYKLRCQYISLFEKIEHKNLVIVEYDTEAGSTCGWSLKRYRPTSCCRSSCTRLCWYVHTSSHIVPCEASISDQTDGDTTVAIAGKSVSNASQTSPFPPDPDSQASTVDTVVREIREAGGAALPVHVDVRRFENVQGMIESVIEVRPFI